MSSLGDNTVTPVTIVENCHLELSPSRARMCVIKNLTPTRIETCSSSVTKSHHIVTMSISHIREGGLVTLPMRLAKFKRQLKRGPRLPRKMLAVYVIELARKRGLA
jgi:hypothetical protein